MSEDVFSEQTPFGTTEFADNPEPRCPCLLLLDTSGSMNGQPIKELNDGIQAFREELLADSLAAKRVEVGIVSFGPINTVQDFSTVGNMGHIHLSASGDTPMGGAIVQGLELLTVRKNTYRTNAIPFFRPWVFLITDGAPTDSWKTAADMVRQGEEKKNFSFFAVGVEGANMGDNDFNKKLSQRRANSTKNWLVEQGISSSRIKAVGYGETKLLNKCRDKVKCSEEEHQINRRSEFKIIAGPQTIEIKVEEK